MKTIHHGKLIDLPKRKLPAGRVTSTFTLPGSNETITVDLIVMPQDDFYESVPEADRVSWDELPESTQAGWQNYGSGYLNLHIRIIEG